MAECAWCHEDLPDRGRSYKFDIGVLGGRYFTYPYARCVLHPESGPWHEYVDIGHECLCGHTSNYHTIRMNADHAWLATRFEGVQLCNPCARFIATATRRRLAVRRDEEFEYVEPIENALDEPKVLADATDKEIAAAARQLLRTYERSA